MVFGIIIAIIVSFLAGTLVGYLACKDEIGASVLIEATKKLNEAKELNAKIETHSKNASEILERARILHDKVEVNLKESNAILDLARSLN